MGEVERVAMDQFPLVPVEGRLARTHTSYPGQPLTYEAAACDLDASWALLSKGMQEWAEQRAGPEVRDPHTKQPTIYWYCRVIPTLTDGPAGAARPASYALAMFGKRALVVSTGTTHNLAEADGPRWEHRRFDVEIDPAGLRHDHHPQAPANRERQTERSAGRSQDTATDTKGLLPEGLAGVFGNLPVATQSFLLDAFVTSGTRPAECNVHAATRVFGDDYHELLWAYLFNAHRMGFAFAHRSVPWRSGLTGPGLWIGSPEAEAIIDTPWTVVAWTAPGKGRRGTAQR